MFSTHRALAAVLCFVILLMAVAGCTLLTPEVITVQATVVVTATLPEETAVPEPTATDPVATPELSATQAPPPTPTQTATQVPTVPPPPPPPPSPTSPPPPTALPTLPPPAEPAYDARQDPIGLLASYYNAINRGEYQRAWDYWESAPNPSYQDFVQGFADTASVLLVVKPPAYVEGAAGSSYAAIPALLSATHHDSSLHNFVGCFVTRRTNLGDPGVEQEWSLYSATVSLTPGNSTDAVLLAGACQDAPDVAYDDTSRAVSLLASYYDAVNRQDYPRAWDYWESAPNPTYQDFVQGYADTGSVLLVLRPPTSFEGAAGSVYTAIPVLLSATHLDSSEHNFVGCFVARRPNVGDPGAQTWSLYDAMLSASPGNSRDVTQLNQACDAR